eukprot:521055_1
MSMMPISQSYHVLTAATRYVVYAICNNHPLTTERYHRIKFEIILSGDPLKARLQHPRKEYPTKENETVVPRTTKYQETVVPRHSIQEQIKSHTFSFKLLTTNCKGAQTVRENEGI